MAIRAHYDGHVIVPDEPLDLPSNQLLEVELRILADTNRQQNPEVSLKAIRNLVARALPGLDIPVEQLRRESIYEERR